MFDVFDGEYIKIKKDYNEDKILFLNEAPDIKFILEEENEKEYKLYPNIDIYNYDVLYGKKYLRMLEKLFLFCSCSALLFLKSVVGSTASNTPWLSSL